MNKKDKKDKKEKIDEIIDQLSIDNKFLIEINDENEKRIINERENLPKKENIAFSESMLKSSLMENKILSGLNYNINDLQKFSSNLVNKNSNTIFNKNFAGIKLLNKRMDENNIDNNIKSFDVEHSNLINNENSDSDKEENIISTKNNNKNNL